MAERPDSILPRPPYRVAFDPSFASASSCAARLLPHATVRPRISPSAIASERTLLFARDSETIWL